MIFPEEYKFVGYKEEERRGDPIYFATQYLICRKGPSLYRVKSSGEGFMRRVDSLELIASGKEIVEHPPVDDISNRARLIELASEICRSSKANTVIFKGPDEHITFVHNPDPGAILTLEILDVAPPEPPWLVYSIERLQACGVLGDLTVRFEPRLLDLRDYKGQEVYYPCRAAGLGRSLDSDKVVHNRPRIVGCEVSRQIFLANYGCKSHDFVNICPPDSIMPTRPFIARCCRSERRGLVTRNGHRGIIVHWGERPWAIAEAVRCLAEELRR